MAFSDIFIFSEARKSLLVFIVPKKGVAKMSQAYNTKAMTDSANFSLESRTSGLTFSEFTSDFLADMKKRSTNGLMQRMNLWPSKR